MHPTAIELLDRLEAGETVRVRGIYFAHELKDAAEARGFKLFAEVAPGVAGMGAGGVVSLSRDDEPA